VLAIQSIVEIQSVHEQFNKEYPVDRVKALARSILNRMLGVLLIERVPTMPRMYMKLS
jgi:hypothetical protein